MEVENLIFNIRQRGSVNVNRLHLSLRNVERSARSVTNVIRRLGSVLKSSFDNSSIKKFAGTISNITRSIGRIAFYRAIRAAIKYVTEAFEQGAENAYWFSRKFGDATKYISEAYDRLSSNEFKMSNQMGAAWTTMIATIEPIIMQIINLVTKAADALTRFFAILGGKTTYMKAIDYTKAWADETDKGNKSAKEWKNQLMGFDEINRLEEPSNSTKKNKNNYDDYQNMFEEVPVGDWFEEIKRAFENGQWKELGKMLGDKVNEMIESVDWSWLGRKFGKNVAGVIETAYSFLKTVDFKNLGSKIAEFLNSAGDQINFNTLGRLVTRIQTALWDVLYGALVSLDWASWGQRLSDYVIGRLQELAEWIQSLDPELVATAIKDFFANIKYDEIGRAFLDVLKSAVNFAFDLTHELFPDGLIPTLVTAIGEFLAKAFAAIKSGDFAAAANVFHYKLYVALFGENFANMFFSNLGEIAGMEIIRGLMEGEEKSLPSAHSTNVRNGKLTVDALVEGIDEEKGKAASALEEVAKESGEGYKTGLSAWAEASKDSWLANVFRSLVDKVKSILGIASPSTVFQEIGANTIEGFKNGIESAWGAVTSFFETSLNTLKTSFENTWNTIKEKTNSTWETIKNSTSTTWENIKSTLSSKWENIKSSVSTAWENIKQKISGTNTQIESETTTQASKIRDTTTREYDSMRNSVQNTINNMKSTILNAWTQITNTTTQNVNSMRSQITSTFNSIYSELASTVRQIKELMNFEWSIPRPKIPVISWYYDYVQSGDGSTFAIPQFLVNWYAKGGIFDEATLIGVGENGKEAVVPLENNTEWIDMIAARMQKSGGMDAGGTADAVEEGSLEIVNALYAATTQIIAAMKENGNRETGSGDFDSFVRKVTNTQRKQARASGLA